MRDEFTARTKRTLEDRAGNCCSLCSRPTSAPAVDEKMALRNGIAAHITAASPGGPRYDPGLSTGERKSLENGIWLCMPCSKEIDDDQTTYSTVELHRIKATAEGRAAYAREIGSRERPHIPAPPPSGVFDKNGTVEKIIASIQSNRCTAIVGMTGIGKSTIAAEAAKRCSQNYSVFWADATSNQSLLESLRRNFQEAKKETQSTDAERSLAQMLNLADRSNSILVLDNITSHERIEQALRNTHNARLLCTSYQADLFDDPGINKVTIEGLSDEEGYHFLASRIKVDIAKADAEAISSLVDGHTMALSQVASLVNNYDYSLRKVGETISNTTDCSDLNMLPALPGNRHIEKLIGTAIAEAVNREPGSKDLLVSLSAIGPFRLHLPTTLTLTAKLRVHSDIQTTTSTSACHRAASPLSVICIAKYFPEDATIQIHSLACKVVRKMFPVQISEAIATSTTNCAEHWRSKQFSQMWDTEQTWRTAAISLSKHIAGARDNEVDIIGPEAAAMTCHAGSMIIMASGDMENAADFARHSRKIREKFHGEMHPATATSLHQEAAALEASGQTAEAMATLSRAMVIDEERGAAASDIIGSMSLLATLYRKTGNLEGAIKCIREALSICDRFEGEDVSHERLNLLSTQHHLAIESSLPKLAADSWKALTQTACSISPRTPNAISSIISVASSMLAMDIVTPVTDQLVAKCESGLRAMSTDFPDLVWLTAYYRAILDAASGSHEKALRSLRSLLDRSDSLKLTGSLASPKAMTIAAVTTIQNSHVLQSSEVVRLTQTIATVSIEADSESIWKSATDLLFRIRKAPRNTDYP